MATQKKQKDKEKQNIIDGTKDIRSITGSTSIADESTPVDPTTAIASASAPATSAIDGTKDIKS